MKKIMTAIAILLLNSATAQHKDAKLLLKLAYFNNNNSIPSLQVTAMEKTNTKLLPVSDLPVELYLQDNRIATVITDATGKASATLPPTLQAVWKAVSQLSFIAKSNTFHTTQTLDITKARLVIDTILNDDGTRTVAATIQEWHDDAFVNVKDVDIKIGVQRLASFLPVGDEESYTSDSSGKVTATFTRQGLPGDEKGNLVVVARTEDNDTYGNLSSTMKVPWGAIHKTDDFGFKNRSLWGTNDKAPIVLVIFAYPLIIAVWGILFFLIYQIVKIKRLGKTDRYL